VRSEAGVPDLKPVLIYGNGAMARLLHSYIRHTRPVLGFTVDDHVMQNAQSFCGLPLHAFSAIETTIDPKSCELIVAVGFAEMNSLRKRKSSEATAKGFRLTSYVHPGLIQHDGVEIGANCIILDQVSVHPGCRIGDGVFISSNVNLGHDCTLGDYCWLNAGVALGGNCRVGEGAFFGVNASAANDIEIGEHAFIGANTLADKDVAPTAVIIAPGGSQIRLKSQDFLHFARLA
jgi:sugar O-acyltransferase (sialic acid O-acetyltransferase NeuD family)